MKIVIYSTRRAPRLDISYPYILLYQDNWNDFGFQCRFISDLVLSASQSITLGPLRISNGKEGFREDSGTIIESLPVPLVSLGESIAYYRRLKDISPRIRNRYLKTMRDLVKYPQWRRAIEDTKIWKSSFMREAASRHALKRGGYYVDAPKEDVAPPQFSFRMQLPGAASPHKFSVDFSQHQELPHRITLLIGRNGTGKTRCLAGLVTALTPRNALVPRTRTQGAELSPDLEISRLIAISYNAFDEFPLPQHHRGVNLFGAERKSRHSYKYCGLRNEEGEIKVAEVGKMLDDALKPVADSEREDVLHRVLTRLLGVDLADALTKDRTRADALASLSAGQRLVAAIFTNIVGFVEEGSLLLIDEPETHLHPGLLASVAAALDDVLNEFDSYAIIATHSPFLLQQVPGSFVRVFNRIDDMPDIRPLAIESFGEDLGELSRNVLGLADPEKDFTSVLDDLYEKYGSAAAVAELFPHRLGIPASAHLYALDSDNTRD